MRISVLLSPRAQCCPRVVHQALCLGLEATSLRPTYKGPGRRHQYSPFAGVETGSERVYNLPKVTDQQVKEQEVGSPEVVLKTCLVFGSLPHSRNARGLL